MKYYKKDINGKVTEISEDTKHVYCSNNNLTELEIPKGIEYVHCDYIKDISKQFNKVEKRIEIYI